MNTQEELELLERIREMQKTIKKQAQEIVDLKNYVLKLDRELQTGETQ